MARSSRLRGCWVVLGAVGLAGRSSRRQGQLAGAVPPPRPAPFTRLLTARSVLDHPQARNHPLDAARIRDLAGLARCGDLSARQVAVPQVLSDHASTTAADLLAPDDVGWHLGHSLAHALERWREVYMATARANGGEPDAGSRLLSWARAAGLRQVEASASTWCYATPELRSWWGGTWAERCLTSFGPRAVELGLTSAAELEEMAAAWREWAAAPDGWYVVVHGEILARR